jgi:rhodanese-related sulfurtransferase
VAQLVTAIRNAMGTIAPRLIIYDCRYPYEFDGGHIDGAQHLDVAACSQVFTDRFFSPDVCTVGQCRRDVVIVFHCEFSRHRGPNAYVRAALTRVRLG